MIVRRRLIALCMIFAMAVSIATPGFAQSQDFMQRIPEVLIPEQHGQIRTRVGGLRIPLGVVGTDLPGLLSPELSTACSQNQFNQKDFGKFYVLVPFGAEPPRRYGYASGTGRNLRDLKGLRNPDHIYMFHRDGTSNCVVYDLLR